MTERVLSSMEDVCWMLGNFRAATRHLSPISFRWEHGAFAVSALREANAEQLLIAFREHLPEPDARTIVGILLDAGLTLEAAIEGSLPHDGTEEPSA